MTEEGNAPEHDAVDRDGNAQSVEPAVDAGGPGDELGIAPASLERDEQQALLTALLFTGGEVLTEARLEEHFALDAAGLELLTAETAGALRPLGLDILKAAGGYRLVTAAQWDPFLRDFYRQVRKAKLTRNALEILAVIAYEQPVTRTRVDELRQSNSESSIRTLLERRLITVAGRDEGPGRPFRYRTTDAFLELFGLATLADLPPRPASFDLAHSAGFGVEADEDEGTGGDQDDIAV